MTDKSTDIENRRRALVAESMQTIKDIISTKGVNRDALTEVKDLVAAMTRETELFSDSEFPTPKPEEIAKIYLLSDEKGGVIRCI